MGQFNGESLILREVYRFGNEPVIVLGTLHWDILRLYRDLVQGLRKVARQAQDEGLLFASLGIDSWAVDYGLLDSSGSLLGNPVHYRDRRTAGVMERITRSLGAKALFERTGIQFLSFNTLYQLVAMQESKNPQLEHAETLLMIPDLLGYFLTGERSSEFTNSTTTQLINVHTGEWDWAILKRLSVPERIFTPIHAPGQRVMPIRGDVANELGTAETRLISVASHDTASAVAAVPSLSRHFAYISSGTWSLLGTEVDHPLLTEETFSQGFTNEGGVGGRYRLLKNIMGLWLLQELQREWQDQGQLFSWQTLIDQAAASPDFFCLIDPDDSRFLSPGAMTVRIQQFCRETRQPVPESIGEYVRAVLESLALKYRWVLEHLERLLGYSVEGIHVVGGGSQNVLLCQWTADACQRPVFAGPVEASATGNLLVQLAASGEVNGIEQARELVRRSFPVRKYESKDAQKWDVAYHRFKKIIMKL